MNAIHFDFSDARVLVTGGSNGIGLAVARAFAAAGAHVTVTGRRPRPEDYGGALDGLAYRPLEVREAGALAALADSLGALDVLVNNAGANFAMQPSEWQPDTFEDAVRVNLFSAFRLATACKPLLERSRLDGGASVLNVASMASFVAVPPVPGYGAAKAGIVQMTKNLAVAWAASGIRVNAVAPGLIETNMTRGMKGRDAVERPQLERTPLRRWGVPDDVAPAFLFLASGAARFITGETLAVDGGYLAT